MAGYQQAAKTGYSGNKNRPAVASASSKPTMGTASAAETVFKTGLWVKTDKETGEVIPSKSLASVQLKEAVTIPAGSYINLFQNDKRPGKEATDPDFTINVRTGTLKG